MSRGRTPTIIETIDGIDYIYDGAKAAEIWRYLRNKCKKKDGTIQRIIAEIAAETHYEEPTVRDWLKGAYGPGKPEAIDVIAEKLGCDRSSLLKTYIKEEKNKMEEIKITKMERKAARKLYGELCDMLQIIDWEDEKVWMEFPDARIQAYDRFRNQYEAEQYYLLLVRKASVDLPKAMREDIVKLINDSFEFFSDCIDPPYELNEETEGYKKITSGNGVKRDVDAIYKYVNNYKQQISDRLDTIFDRYIRK